MNYLSTSESRSVPSRHDVILQRRCACGGQKGPGGTCSACAAGGVRASRRAAAAAPAPGAVQHALSSRGEALPGELRTLLESRMGHDFSQVRVHSDSRAARSAAAVQADAYTVGKHIVFGESQYRPHTQAGKRLLAHELAHVVQQSHAGSTLQTQLRIGSAADSAEHEAEQAASRTLAGLPVTIQQTPSSALQCYHHEDCSDEDLRNHVWPANHNAEQMTEKAIRVLGAATIDASVTPLLDRYFMSTAPDVAEILDGYRNIKAAFDDDDYTYECEDDCDDGGLGYVYGLWSDIHLCMNTLRGWANDCIARTIVHEFSHYYDGTDDESYCKAGCGYTRCPATLSEDDALDNADSYACFAYELFPMGV